MINNEYELRISFKKKVPQEKLRDVKLLIDVLNLFFKHNKLLCNLIW